MFLVTGVFFSTLVGRAKKKKIDICVVYVCVCVYKCNNSVIWQWGKSSISKLMYLFYAVKTCS